MDFESVNYFTDSIREQALLFNMDFFVRRAFQNSEEDLLKRKYEREIFEKNKDTLKFFFELLKYHRSCIDTISFFSYDHYHQYRNICEDILKEKKILRTFNYFNKSFCSLLIKLSCYPEWGAALSTDYISRYYTEN